MNVESLPQQSRRVWDLPVRLMHAGLAVAVAGCWLTQEIEGDYFAWHVRCGYAVLAIACVRILWGFFGTRHARFRAFVRGPRVVLHYARSLLSSSSQHFVGHNPLGAVAIVLMLALLLTQAVTGLFANDQILNTGPLFGYVTASTSDRLTSIHRQVFDFIWVLVALHVVAVVAYWIIKRDNLILPMITGRKAASRVPVEQAIDGSRLPLWLGLIAVVSAAIYWIVRTAPEGSLAFF